MKVFLFGSNIFAKQNLLINNFLIIKPRQRLYHLALKLKMIEILELDWLCNTRYATLYNFFYVLISVIKKY